MLITTCGTGDDKAAHATGHQRDTTQEEQGGDRACRAEQMPSPTVCIRGDGEDSEADEEVDEGFTSLYEQLASANATCPVDGSEEDVNGDVAEVEITADEVSSSQTILPKTVRSSLSPLRRERHRAEKLLLEETLSGCSEAMLSKKSVCNQQ